MNHLRHFFLYTLLALAGALLQAQPGTIDPSFNPVDPGFGSGDGANSVIYAMTLQPDGKILIGGFFTSYNGTARNRIARLNADGSLDTSFDPGAGANSTVRAIALQPDGKILIGGDFGSYNGTTRNRVARLNADGSLDTSFDPGTGANSTVEAMALQPDGKILIGGWFSSYNGTPRNRVARLNADGTLDMGFDPGTGTNSQVYSGQVLAIVLQPDGKILIGGAFDSYNGTTRNYIARLNADGSLDTGFDPGTGANNGVNAIALQPDGKILIAGFFTNYNGTPRNRVARLNADGSLDTGFDPGSGAIDVVFAMALQPDGKILIGGNFINYNLTTRNRVARLNANGSLDTGFDPGTGANGRVHAIALQPNGQILIGGWFDNYNGTPRNCIARLNAGGSLDIGFDPTGTGANSVVWITAVQPDGKILIGGSFTSYNGTGVNYIARLNADGRLDAGFNPGTGADNAVRAIALQPDGKILIGGFFTSYNGTPRNRISRLNVDGSLDADFDPGMGANNTVLTIALQPDGKILIGGGFTIFDGVPRNRIARLNTNGTLDISFDPGTGADNVVRPIALQPDGKILIGGQFTSFNGTLRNRIARLNADGSLDTGFNPGTGANNIVYSMALQPDGKILIGGGFANYNGAARNRVARLNADGSLDTGFDPGTGANAPVLAMALQPNGKILIGGFLLSYNDTPRNRIARLNPDSSLDAGFDPGTGADEFIWTMALQPDGKILIGGDFTSFNGTGRNRIARVNGGGAAACSLTINSSTPTPETCPGANDGSIVIHATCAGCIGALEYSINNGSSFQPGSTFGSLPDGVYQIVVQDAGNTSCSATGSATVNAGVDNTPPTAQCFNQTVYFNGEESIALDADALADASDNCGVQSISLSPSTISAVQVGQIVPLTVTVTDINGNPATCTTQVNVGGLSAGWSENPTGIGCAGPCNNFEYNPTNGVWTGTSTGAFYGPPYNSDVTAFAQRTLCGNGSITARVMSIGGIGGWAGVTMRETNAAGAKKVQLMTNLSNFVRAEVRYTTGDQAYPADLFSFQRFWVRIMRQGNEFTGFVSSDGNLWIQTFSVLVPMNSCIQMGLVMTNFQQNGTGTATFDNVSTTGSNVPPMVGAGSIAEATPAAWIEQPHGFEVYPNPTSGELNVDMTQYVGRAVRLEVYSLEGKLLQFSEIDEVQATVERLNLSDQHSGMYLVKVKSGGLPDATRRVVLTR